MKTMKWLIKREFWEHKGMVLWAPAVVAGLIALMTMGGLLMGRNVSFGGEGGGKLSVELGGQARDTVVAMIAEFYTLAAMPILVMLGFLVFFYCLGALHDDRRDRSLLFWKSLPVSDLTTVLSKVALALVVLPLVAALVGIVLSLAIVLMAGASMALHGLNMFGPVMSSASFYLSPLRLLGLLPVYMLWALPTVGWLLLVSSWARSKVFLWAVGAPLVTAALIAWTNKIFALGMPQGWFMEHIVSRILLGVAPGSWFMFSRVNPQSLVREGADHIQAADLFSASWGTLGNPALWVGVAAGVAMIAGAVWLRRWREEG
jgi:ABC-2 type transport system permease protein